MTFSQLGAFSSPVTFSQLGAFSSKIHPGLQQTKKYKMHPGLQKKKKEIQDTPWLTTNSQDTSWLTARNLRNRLRNLRYILVYKKLQNPIHPGLQQTPRYILAYNKEI